MPEAALNGVAAGLRSWPRARAMAVVAVAACSHGLALAGSARADEPFRCPQWPADSAAAEQLARKLFEDAVAREPADPQGALARLRCAQGAADRPAVALRIGTIHERMGRLDEAADAFDRYLELAGKDAPDASEMREHVARLREGARRARTKPAAPAAAPVARATPSTIERPLIPPVVAWVVAGVGGATVVSGVVLLVDAKAKDDSVHDLQGARWSDEAAGPTYHDAKTEQAVGIGALVVGTVLAAAGLACGLTGKPSSTVAAGSARAGHGAQVALRF